MLSESIAASGCGGTVWFSGSSSVLGEVLIVALLVVLPNSIVYTRSRIHVRIFSV